VREQEYQMGKKYRLRLTEVTGENPEREAVQVSVSGDAHAIVGWLLSIAETVATEAQGDEEDVLGHLYRLSLTQSERVARRRRDSERHP
jgi:hypothetical protein